MISRPILALCAIALLLPAPAWADERRDAIVAQTAAAVASSEFAEQHCPNIRVDHKLIAEKAQDAGVSVASFKSDESYEEQRRALASVRAQNGTAMVCVLLPSAHGGIARGIITKR